MVPTPQQKSAKCNQSHTMKLLWETKKIGWISQMDFWMQGILRANNYVQEFINPNPCCTSFIQTLIFPSSRSKCPCYYYYPKACWDQHLTIEDYKNWELQVRNYTKLSPASCKNRSIVSESSTMVTFPSPGFSVWENMRTPQVQLFSRNSLLSPKLLLVICSSRGPLQRDKDQQQPNVISLRDPNPSPVTIFDERTLLCAAATK